MAETAKKTVAKKTTAKKTAAKKTTAKKADPAFTAEERAAMKEAAKERRSRGGKPNLERDLADLLAKVADLPEPDRALATRLHEVVTAGAPQLAPRTWYGMPAYALDGKVLAFFQPASKFKARYGTFGFNDVAALDDGAMWPTSFAVVELTTAVEKEIAALVRRAVGA